MNPFTHAYVYIPAELGEASRTVLVRNLQSFYKGEPASHPSRGRYLIYTFGQWQLEIETKLRTGVDYHGRLSIHCFSPQRDARIRGGYTRNAHRWD